MTTPRKQTPTRTAGVRAAPLGRALAEAADQAAAALGGGAGAPPEATVRAELTRLCDHVCVVAEAPPGGNSPAAAPSAFSRAHVDAFRRAFLFLLADGHLKRASGQVVVSALRALDLVPTREDGAMSRESVDRLVRADALNGMLEIAHDMRSPLSAILLLVDPIRRGQHGPVNETQERQLGMVYGAALSLSTLANDIIDAARGDGAATLATHPFSVSGTIHDACAIVSPIAAEKSLDLRQVYPTVDGRIGNSAAIHRVLLNLTTNALKYTERGSVTVGCSELGDSRVEFWVKDTGRGIPSSVLDKLFDEFRPGPVGSRFYSSGLGLSICRRLVERMGGALRVETSPEQGTRFSFAIDLPVAESAPRDANS